jgi:hypothetical protein
LLGEDRILQAVAGVVEADHQAVADQLVVANALNVRDVLDPGLCAGIARRKQDGQQEQADEGEEREWTPGRCGHGKLLVKEFAAGWGDAMHWSKH